MSKVYCIIEPGYIRYKNSYSCVQSSNDGLVIIPNIHPNRSIVFHYSVLMLVNYKIIHDVNMYLISFTNVQQTV